MTLSAHYFFGAKQYYEGVLSLVVVANVMMFMTWGLTKSTGKYYATINLVRLIQAEILLVTISDLDVPDKNLTCRLVVYLPYVRLSDDSRRHSTVDHWQQNLASSHHARVRLAQRHVVFDLAHVRTGTNATL